MSELVLEDGPTAGLAPSRSKPNLKRLAIWAALSLGLLTATAYGYRWWSAARWIESTDDAYVGGNVTAISPHVAGFVAEILVQDNQHVQAGELLIRLDNRDFQTALVRAEAVVQQRQAALDNLHAKYRVQRSVIRQAEAELRGKNAMAAFARQDAERYRNLASRRTGSEQDAQKAAALNEQAQATIVSAQAALDAARQQLAVLDSEIGVAGAVVAEAKADLETARLKVGYTEIRSPIDGYIGNRGAQVGAYVSEGAYLLTVIPAQGLWVDANFKEDQLGRMRPGQPATVVADVMPDRVLHGRIASLSPATGAIFSIIPPENATGNFTKIVQRLPVRIALDGDGLAPDGIRPGLSTTVTVNTRSE